VGNWFPFESGMYSVGPGLRLLACRTFLIEDFSRYRREKLAARAARTVYMESDCPERTKAAAAHFIAGQLVKEYPESFEFSGPRLACRLTGDTVEVTGAELDRLLMQVAEDVAVFQVAALREYLAVAQICMPSSWRLEEKIGRSFADIHEPVPGMKLENASDFARSLAAKGPYERFAWGLTNEDVLDQYAPAHAEVQPDSLFVRVERQTTHPLPCGDAWMFTIRPMNTSVDLLSGPQRESLAKAIESMTEAQAIYKGVAGTRKAIVERLRSGG